MPADDNPPRGIGAVLETATEALRDVPDGSPFIEAQILLGLATGLSRTQMLAWPERNLAPDQETRFADLLNRRIAGEPIAYIRGRQSFWTFDLRVTPDTLIPRPETELLVETTLDRLQRTSGLRVADLGTGSGAIAAALALERPEWHLIATERSGAALEIARQNFDDLHLQRIAPVQTHWLTPFADAGLDAIVSNPPYIAAVDPHLERGDLRFEPRQALTPEGDGLDAIRVIAVEARRCLRPDGLVAVEHGFDQGEAVHRIFTAQGLLAVETRQDLAGLDRITLGYR
ncbi:peptide chain release factor N(5)-glutamine methyltransferase [Imhoffiella purpurea]|uniref:Release factor glutamine methyltransferase n=1 Tax=Imhoffiella purpurea TaxID=1249627 RepID=W9V8F2_9GAMM|nr:peptide chain release factor N(5)-glutamine methyltransferase [Imhoffiella purpurea]EXJ15853.1 Methylase of polypeptide chain release factors [Imhoffiella purpurea]